MIFLDTAGHAAAPRARSIAPDPPPPEAFAPWAQGWYIFGESRELDRGPVSRDLFGQRVVAYRTACRRLVAMNARCWHLGADLGGGSVVEDRIRCPFHAWEFAPDGACARVPACQPPPDAQQPTFAVEERAGKVFVFPSSRPAYPAPFFAGIAPADLVAAPPFEFIVDCPWWLVGTNGFDVQHFMGAHDRRLVAPPVVDSPHPAARRVLAEFEVCGTGWRDRVTRRFSGPRVMMDVTVWSGTLVFVAARFRRTTSYGLVEIRPAGAGGERPRTPRAGEHLRASPGRRCPGAARPAGRLPAPRLHPRVPPTRCAVAVRRGVSTAETD